MRVLLPLKYLSVLITQTKEKLQRFPSIRSRKPTARMGINAHLLSFFSPAVPVVDCPHPAEEDAAHLEMQELRLEPRIPLCLHFFLHLPLTPFCLSQSVCRLENNFQTWGRMRGEGSLWEQEMLLEQRAGSRESRCFRGRLVANF